jgi:hypothetical protein
MKSMCRHLWGAFLLAVQAIKDAASDIRVNSAILLSVAGKAAWVIPLLLVPSMFKTFPTVYSGFSQNGSERQWATLVCALILLDVAAMTHRGFYLQVTSLIVSGWLWFFFCSLISQHVPRGLLGTPGAPSAYLYLFGGVGCFVGLFRIVQNRRAKFEAIRMQAMAKDISEARKRGEAWAQPIN